MRPTYSGANAAARRGRFPLKRGVFLCVDKPHIRRHNTVGIQNIVDDFDPRSIAKGVFIDIYKVQLRRVFVDAGRRTVEVSRDRIGGKPRRPQGIGH